jgi:hypothetical protein
MEIISREAASLVGKRRYFTGKPCVHGHVAERFVCNTGCVECVETANAKYTKKFANPMGFVPVTVLVPLSDRAMIEELAASLRASHIPAPVAVPSSIAYVKKNADQ